MEQQDRQHSLEHQDTGLIPGPAQWVKDLAFLQLWHRSQLWLGSDPWARNSICHMAAKKEKKKKKKASTVTILFTFYFILYYFSF